MKNNDLPPLYLLLASMSRYRAQCLAKLQLDFKQWAPHIDESARKHESPKALVQRLAREKAHAGFQQVQTLAEPVSHIIGSDQVMLLNEQVLGKPHTFDKALQQLQAMSGKQVTFITSLCLMDAASGAEKTVLEQTQVQFRKLSQPQIEKYLQMEQPFDCAGSFKSEQGGIVLCESIQGRDPHALVGLPLIALTDLLLEAGYSLPLT